MEIEVSGIDYCSERERIEYTQFSFNEEKLNHIGGIEDLMEKLYGYGLHGWELCGIVHTHYILKRKTHK